MAAENKTQKTTADVDAFIDAIDDERKRDDSREVMEMMREVTGLEPYMWGASIVGFGDYHYKYESGREGDCPVIGFSPRKAALTLYIFFGFEQHKELWEKLGKYTTGKSCLYIKKLDDVDRKVLKKLLKESVKATTKGEGIC